MSVDVVVVGAGSAGVTVACRLSEDPGRSVLLLEAGLGAPSHTDADLLSNVSFATTGRDWGLRAQVSGERQLDYPQGKFVGGGSSVNGALAFRGAPEDFEGWLARGNPSWGWPPMLEAYRRLEHDLDYGDTSVVHGDDGPVPIVRWHEAELVDLQMAFRQACLELGYPVDGRPQRSRLHRGRIVPDEPRRRATDVDRPHLPTRGPRSAQLDRLLRRSGASGGPVGRAGLRRGGRA